jgi:hypothetical protein
MDATLVSSTSRTALRQRVVHEVGVLIGNGEPEHVAELVNAVNDIKMRHARAEARAPERRLGHRLLDLCFYLGRFAFPICYIIGCVILLLEMRSDQWLSPSPLPYFILTVGVALEGLHMILTHNWHPPERSKAWHEIGVRRALLKFALPSEMEEEENAFQKFLDAKTPRVSVGEVRECPKCSCRIFKSAGCDRMWCAKCRHVFNWENALSVDVFSKN